MYDLGCRVYGLGFGVWILGSRVYSSTPALSSSSRSLGSRWNSAVTNLHSGFMFYTWLVSTTHGKLVPDMASWYQTWLARCRRPGRWVRAGTPPSPTCMQVLGFGFYVLCFMFYVLCFMFYVLCLMF